MRRIGLLLTVCGVIAPGFALRNGPVSAAGPEKEAPRKAAKPKILFYSQSFGYRHGVVTRPLTGELSHAEKVFKQIATKAGYEVFLSQDFHDLGGDACKQYDAIVFYTSGNPLISRGEMMKWLRAGGALIGIHSATDSFRADADYAKGWPEYVKSIGAAFKTHGQQRAPVMKVEVPDHPATAMLDKEWKLLDEIYVFTEESFSRDNVRVLISVDTAKTPEADLKAMQMTPGGDHAIAWTNTVGKGRVFYTSLGHRKDVWTNPTYQQHLLGGIAWALGKD